MEVRLKLEHPLAKLPERKHVTDAGYDCYAVDMRTDEFGNLVYSLGFSIEIPVGFVGLLFPRSSCSSTDFIMANCVGVIDSGYRGIVSAKFKTLNTEAATLSRSDNPQQISEVSTTCGLIEHRTQE